MSHWVLCMQAITSLKKLCNHPKLIYDAVVKSKGKQPAVGFEVSEAAHALFQHVAVLGSAPCHCSRAQPYVPIAAQNQ